MSLRSSIFMILQGVHLPFFQVYDKLVTLHCTCNQTLSQDMLRKKSPIFFFYWSILRMKQSKLTNNHWNLTLLHTSRKHGYLVHRISRRAIARYLEAKRGCESPYSKVPSNKNKNCKQTHKIEKFYENVKGGILAERGANSIL